MSQSQTESAPRIRRRGSAAAFVVLTVVWMLLWDQVSLFIIVTGLLLALLVAGSVATSLLTLYAMAKVWNRAFWRPRSAEPDPHELVAGGDADGAATEAATTTQTTQRRRLPRPMVAIATVCVLLGVGITVVSGPLYGFTQRSATDIVGGLAYVRAVLPEGIR